MEIPTNGIKEIELTACSAATPTAQVGEDDAYLIGGGHNNPQ